MAKLTVQNTAISVLKIQDEDFISLTDMAHSQLQEHIVFRWMSLKSTIEYLGEWELLYNPNFNCTEFDTIKNAAGSNNFVLSVKAQRVLGRSLRPWNTNGTKGTKGIFMMAQILCSMA